MGRNRIAAMLSIAVSALLAALVTGLILPQSAEHKERPRKQDRPAAKMKPPGEQPARALRIARLRLPPPPIAAEPAGKTLPKAAPAAVTVRVTPLRPAKPAKPAIKVVAKTPPRTPPTPPPTPTPGRVNAASRKAGRALLRLLEHGKGPSVEIAWPDSPARRGELYRWLKRCTGMRDAVMDGGGRLFAATGPAGAPWRMNLDRYSGFLRVPAGVPVPEESRTFATIGARHSLADWRPVRIFPRAVDAVLLGGLQRIIGGAYGGARTITAAYRLQGSRVFLDSIRVNGRSLAGEVELTATARAGCRART